MHDGGKIAAGLVIFLALVTLPMWYQVARGAETKPPKLALVADSKDCVAPNQYMRVLHMDLLNVWRDEAVRDGASLLHPARDLALLPMPGQRHVLPAQREIGRAHV